MKHNRPFAYIGSISTGTLRHCDIIPDLIDMLRELRGSLPRRIARDWRELSALYDLDNMTPDEEQDAVDLECDLADRLYDEINALLPDYLYCGALEGDGADIGIWISHDRLDEDRRSGELPENIRRDGGTLYDGPDPWRSYRGLHIEISDHGNVTLYLRLASGKDRVIWSVA